MFSHLHLHTEFSLLDGLTRISPLMDRVKELGQEAVAMTDHGAMYGAIDFYREAQKRGIKPIIGVEAYVAPGSRHSRTPGDNQPYHLTMLARNKTGYRNLMKLVTASHLEGYYYRPRMDREIMAEHGDGIIVLSGCPSGELHRMILDGRMDDARATINWYREVFDGYYLEIQDHDLPEFDGAKRTIIELSKEMGVPLVATNDSHYLDVSDHDIHDLLLCIGTNTTVQEEKRMKMSDPSYFVRSEEDMRRGFVELPEAVDNTWKIAELCDLELEFGRLHMPEPDLPPGVTSLEYLEKLCWEGLRKRKPDADETTEERLRYELNVIKETGFTNYIHIVREIGTYARTQGIRFGVRGSAAASLVLYCLAVTEIDPMKANLVFERFLNLERPEAPDVDFDFPDDGREELLRWVAARYGSDRVAQIITFGTLGAKAAVRDVGRALGMSYADTDRVARLIPNALHMTLERALNENPELRMAYEADSQVRSLVDQARKLEGVARNASTHAAGVVISRDPLVEHLPLARPARGDEHAMPTTQYAMEPVAAIGLVKMDLLGLSNLSILQRAVDLIKERHGREVDLEHLEDGDEKTFEMLGSGETFGVFQLESAGMRRAVMELKPNSVDDLAALVALYRPGPMQHISTFCRAKHGLEQVVYPHPDLADILDSTYGIIVYQDQVLKIAQKFGGYTLGQADIMRKAMGKKIAYLMQEQRERFMQGAEDLGYRREDAQKVFELIEPFAGYAFNKAHSYSYGTIAYQTAWLKANYAEEYLTAVLMHADSHPAGTHERVAQAFNECVRLGIPVLAPDVNHSMANFSLEKTPEGKVAIRYGLAMIKNVGEGAAESIVESREAAGGRFESLDDFCRSLNTKSVNKRVLESLVKSGCLDSVAGTADARGSLLVNLDRILSTAQSSQKLKESGQATMFDLFGAEVATPLSSIDLTSAPVPKAEVLSWEKDLLGVWLSEHPFTHAAPHLAPYVTALCNEMTPEMMAELPAQGRDFVMAGIVGSTRRLSTRDGRGFIAAEIQDLSGSYEVTVWPDVYDRTSDLWLPGSILVIQVKARERGERISVGVQEVVRYDEGFVAPAWATPVGPETLAARRAAMKPAVPEPPIEALPGTPEPPTREPGEPMSGIAGFDEPPFDVYEDAAPPASPAEFEPGEAMEPPAKAVLADAPEPYVAPPEPPRSEPLRLVLRETDDYALDERRLATVFQLLQERPGKDQVLLSIHTREGERIDLSLPNASLDPVLRDRLEDAVGMRAPVGAA